MDKENELDNDMIFEEESFEIDAETMANAISVSFTINNQK